MVTLKDRYDYLIKIPNTRFMGMSYINLTKQKEGRGSRRSLELELDSLNNPEKVLEILNLALEALQEKNKDFVHTYFCGVAKMGGGAITYKIHYECIPSMKVPASESAVMRSVLRCLIAAGINTGSSMEVQTLDKHLSKTSNRLYETYEYSILKVLSHQEALQLSETAVVANCFKGEKLIRQGEQADSMFLISEGALEVKVKGADGTDITVATLWPGDCVGEMSLMTGAPRSADVYAKADTVVVEITKENITLFWNPIPV
jgi:small-conductance mechanosensitive channel